MLMTSKISKIIAKETEANIVPDHKFGFRQDI